MDKKRLLLIDKQKIRKHYGKTEDEVLEDIEMLKRWINTQKFPEMPTDHMVEFFLTNCKYNLEKTKANMKTYYSIRKQIPEIYKHSNPQSPEMQEVWNMGCYCPLPKPTRDLYRISVINIAPDPSIFDAYKYFSHFMNIYEMRIWEDLVLGEILIIDYKNCTFNHIFHFTPFLLRKMVKILESVAKSRVKCIHIVQAPSFVNIPVNIAKTFLKKKISDRIQIHKTFETVFQYIRQEELPSDYGGKERSLQEIQDMWKEKIKAHQDRYDFLETISR